jgi:hypothetical protein
VLNPIDYILYDFGHALGSVRTKQVGAARWESLASFECSLTKIFSSTSSSGECIAFREATNVTLLASLRRQQLFFLFTKALRPSVGPNQPPSQLVPGAKGQRRKADHSPPTNPEVNYGRAIFPLPRTSSWLGVYS